MSRFTRILAVLSVVGWAASCGAPIESGEFPTATQALYPAPNCVRLIMTDGFQGLSCLANPYSWTEQIRIDGSAAVFAHGEIVRVETGVNSAAWVCDTSYPLGFAQAPYVACWSGGTNYSSQRFRGIWRGDLGAFPPMGADVALVAGHYGRSVVVSRGYLVGAGMQGCPYQGTGFWGNGRPYNFYQVSPESDYGAGAPGATWREDYGPAARISGSYPSGNNGAPCAGYDVNGNYATVVY